MVILEELSAPTEKIHHQQINTKVFISGKQVGDSVGTIFITESKVHWIGSDGKGFTLLYPMIALHAVSKDLTAFPHPCLYLMVEGDLGGDDNPISSEEENNDVDALKTQDVRFAPQDTGALEAMYLAMSDCQVMHPDPTDSLSEDSEGEEFDGEAGGDNLTAQGQATLNRLEAMIINSSDEPRIGSRALDCNGDSNGHAADEQMETGQFEDAEPGH